MTMLDRGDVATRLPAQDMERAASCSRNTNGIATIAGDYPSKGTGALGAWFKDGDGNVRVL
jgi:hypothetical protein